MATFKINQDYIAANLCVNRDNPKMHCNGQCQLDKKLKEDQQQNPTNSEKRISFELTVFIFNPDRPILPTALLTQPTPQNGIPVLFTKQSYNDSLLHPPSLLS